MSDVWYLAGPMSGLPAFNYDAFESAVWQLRERGYEVMSPHEINRGLHGLNMPETPAERRLFMRNNLRVLLDCTGIVLLPGWEQSDGAMLEVRIAWALGLDERTLHELLVR